MAMPDDVRKVISSSFTVLAAVWGMLALLAPMVRADANQYLADLHSPGMAHPSIPDSGLLAIGNDVCAKVSGGATPTAARDWLVDHSTQSNYECHGCLIGGVTRVFIAIAQPPAGH
jgi:hypothetical protein